MFRGFAVHARLLGSDRLAQGLCGFATVHEQVGPMGALLCRGLELEGRSVTDSTAFYRECHEGQR